MTTHEILFFTLFAIELALAPFAFSIGLADGHAMRPVPRLVPVSTFSQYGLIGGYTDECEPARWSEVRL